MLVRDIMSADPAVIDPSTSLPDAMELMKARSIRRLPVVERGRLVGIVTDRDLKEAAPSRAIALSMYELHYLLARTRVSEVMHRDVVTIAPDQNVSEAARLMYRLKIGGIPVVSDDHLVGIITESDVLRTFVAMTEATV